MLTAVKRIKGLGVFSDFTASNDLPPFARYNIIYGENGSGKTTLSRLFAVLESGVHPEFASLEYAFDSQSGALGHGKPYARKVRVFNADYVEANIGQFQGPLRHILIIGEEKTGTASPRQNKSSNVMDASGQILVRLPQTVAGNVARTLNIDIGLSGPTGRKSLVKVVRAHLNPGLA